MLRLPEKILTYPYDILAGRVKPTDPSAPEALPFALYDTQTYLAAGSGTLQFFRNVSADQTISNLESPGQLTVGQFFDIHRIYVDFLRAPTATVADTAAGGINDVELVLKTARAVLSFTTRSKPLGPIPLTFFGASGAAEGVIGSGRAAAAGAVVQVVQGPRNGGYPVNGSIKLGPVQKFAVDIAFAAANVAISADMNIRVSLFGILYRSIA